MDYDNIIEQKFTNALSECLGIDKEIIELLDLKLENNYGNSNEDIFYGYYVEIPNWDDLDKAIQEQISVEIKNEIEWGKIIYISESEFGNTKTDPFNWKSDSEFEYYCITHSTQREDVLFTLKELKSKIEESQDELIIKSLILCAFSITEGFVRSIVWLHIPDIENQNFDNTLKEILKQKIQDNINNGVKRKEIYKRAKILAMEIPKILKILKETILLFLRQVRLQIYCFLFCFTEYIMQFFNKIKL